MQSIVKTGLGLLAGVMLCASQSAPASAETVRGKIYQIEPGCVYVEDLNDHTAVKVPLTGATLKLNGVVTEVTSLKVGDPITADYIPETTVLYSPVRTVPVMYSPSLYSPGYTREIVIDGRTVRQIWRDGHWVDL